jgi:hypothetical protein
VAVTTAKKPHATISVAWLRTKEAAEKVLQDCRRGQAEACPTRQVKDLQAHVGQASARYFSTVRGETRIPSFSFSSLAMRSSPQERSGLHVTERYRTAFLGSTELFAEHNQRKAAVRESEVRAQHLRFAL